MRFFERYTFSLLTQQK